MLNGFFYGSTDETSAIVTHTFTNDGAKFFRGSSTNARTTDITPGIPVSSSITIFFSGGSYDTSGEDQEWAGMDVNEVQFRPSSGGTYTYSFSGSITYMRSYSQSPDSDTKLKTYVVAIDGATDWTYINDTTITTP